MVTIDYLKEIVGNNPNGQRFQIKLSNGKTIQRTLWSTESSYISPVAMTNKGCRTHGHYVLQNELKTWVSVKPVNEFEVTLDLYDNRVRKAVDMLNKSGLWVDIKEELMAYLRMNKAHRQELINDILEDSYEKFFCECKEGGKYSWVRFYQVFETLTKKRCFTSVPLPRYSSIRVYEKQRIVDSLSSRSNYHGRWRNGYDITLDFEVNEKDNKYRGWLSCEYLGCANGHYYLMFDATHAIFYEDD